MASLKYRSGLVVLVALLSAVGPAHPSCPLYDPPTPGITCLSPEGVDNTLTNSRTLWMVEFYSSWCGHCQNFAPVMKEIGSEVANWKGVFRIGLMECTVSKENQKACENYGVEGYPTLKFFRASETLPRKHSKSIVGARDKNFIVNSIVDQLANLTLLRPLYDSSVLDTGPGEWTPTALVFEDKSSYVGRKLALDFHGRRLISVRRVLSNNSGLMKHYSILELPSLVVELTKGDYHVIAGHSLTDARGEFKQTIMKYLEEIEVSAVKKAPAADPQLIDTPPYTPVKINRVHRADLLGAVSYALRVEIPLHSIVSSSAYTALHNFLSLLEMAFREPYPAVSECIQSVRKAVEARSSGHFITRTDWNRIIDNKLDENLFPVSPQWSACAGSQAHLRGYPCSLWMLMHTLTILTLPVSPGTTPTSREALKTMASFIRNFFSCEHCRIHFSQLSQSLPYQVHHDGDAVIWLWEAHNAVSDSLQHTASTDPHYPKALFPGARLCPYCYQATEAGVLLHDGPVFGETGFAPGESLLGRQNVTEFKYVWNKTAVLLYLWNFYHLNPSTHGSRLHVKASSILRAAWGTDHADSAIIQGAPWQRQLSSKASLQGFTSLDRGICYLCYGVCFLFLATAGYWLFRRKRTKKYF